jgi:hypothetical protein
VEGKARLSNPGESSVLSWGCHLGGPWHKERLGKEGLEVRDEGGHEISVDNSKDDNSVYELEGRRRHTEQRHFHQYHALKAMHRMRTGCYLV